jgi:alpha-tubulin suppressor-like RCC1 family protein
MSRTRFEQLRRNDGCRQKAMKEWMTRRSVAARIVIVTLFCMTVVFAIWPAGASAEEPECATITARGVEKQMNLRASETLVKCGKEAGGSSTGSLLSPVELGSAFSGSDIDVITGTETYPHVTQAESSVWSHGSTIIVNYNDGRGDTESPQNYSGVSVSKDGGATFTRLGPPSPFKGHVGNFGDPILVYNEKLGKWFAGDLVGGSGTGECGSQGIGLWTSTNGETWTVGACAHTGNDDDRESMWVDNNPASPFYGRMYISLNNFSVGGGELEVTHSDDGTTWSTPVALTSTFRRDVQLTGSPSSDGTVFVVGQEENGGGVGKTGQQNFMYRSTNGGATWTSVTMGPTFTIAGTTSCGYFPAVPPIWRETGWGQPAVGPNGVVQYVYAAHGSGTDESDIMYVRSTDNGVTWSTPLRLNTDSLGQAQWMPSLRVTSSGVVVASWYDRRNSTNGENYQRFARVSLNNGETWGPDEPLSTVLIPEPIQPDPNIQACYAGDYNYTTANTTTGFDTWTDGRVAVEGHQTEKVFYHSIPLESGPTVTKVVPSEGPEAGGTSVTITGTNFTGATSVKFGTVAATTFKVESPTSIVATSPAHAAGTVDVTVTTPQGTSPINSGDHFTYRVKPAVSNVQPNAGVLSGGTTVMVSGSGFTGATKVSFGASSAASFTVISDTWISAVSPAGSGAVDVTVTTAGGSSAVVSGDKFTYRSGGIALGWGDNSAGELGDGTSTGPELCGVEPCSTLPVGVSGPLSEARAVSAGQDHSLALLKTGSVDAWGYNGAGELGNGTTTSSNVPVTVSGITTATAVSAGNEFSLALLKNGTVDAWGYNASGQLGNGTTTNSSTPVAVSGITEATAISAGENHGLALLKNGKVMAWGNNASGQLGNGTTTNSSVPVTVSGITEAVAVSAGGEYSLAVLKNGTVMSWGANGAGELGNGTTTNSSVPVKVSSLTEVVSVSAGSAHAGALLKTGSVMSWGANQSGQLGNGTCCTQSTVPVKVSSMTEATAIADGFHSLAMLRSGTIQDWGRNSDGQLGVGNYTGPETCETRSCSKIPVTVSGLSGATSVDGGVNYALAVGVESTPPRPSVTNVQSDAGISSGGTTVMISGTSFTGATKVSFGATSAASFTVISGTWISAVSPAGTGTVDVTVTTAGGTSVTGSADHFTYRSGGTVLGWGINSGGELGNGTTTGPETCELEACSTLPVAASGSLSEVASVSAGVVHSLAVLSSGTVMAWGLNFEGELGNGTTTSSSVPIKVSSITTATAASAGNEYSLALLKNGTVDAWGYNASGQLGNGTTTNSSTPVAVSGITEAIAISAGENHGLALLKNGKVMAWGNNASGQLGNGTTTNSSVPVTVSGITEAVAVSAGGEYSLAVLKNGTVMSWGYNGAGQLGNGTTTNSSVPVKVSNITEVVGVAAGSAHALALQKTGSVMSWGANQSGQLGNGTCCTQSTVPVKVSNMTEATAIGSGFHSLAMLRNGTIQDWGRNSWGQLGVGTSTGPETCETRACSKVPVTVSGLTGATSVEGGVNYALAVGSTPSFTQTIDSPNSLNAVTCIPSSTDCVTSDSKGNAFYATNVSASSAATWNSWSGPGTSPSWAVACPTSTLCLLADGTNEVNGGNLYYATSLGGAWTLAYSPVYGVDAISCASSTFCVDGQDNFGYFRYSTNPASTSWTLEEQGSAKMNGVFCLSSSFCAIVDSVGDVHVATTTTQIESSSWTVTDVNGTTAINGIACTSTTSCIAVDGAGNVLNLTINSEGSATVSKQNIDGTNSLTAITCTTGSTCIAVDNAGNVFVSTNNGTNWTKQYALADKLTSVSCSSTSLCETADTTGNTTTINPR